MTSRFTESVLTLSHKALMDTVAGFFCLTVVTILAPGATRADVMFGPPVSLGSPINSQFTEHARGISADGRALYMGSSRPVAPATTATSGDLWISTRIALDAPWSAPVPVSELNTDTSEFHPSVTPDELTIVFEGKNENLWIASRNEVAQMWDAPAELPTPVNSTSRDGAPFISADRLMILFDSNRPGGEGGTDLWGATRTHIGGEWVVANLGSAINTTSEERAPYLSGDGLHLFFASMKSGGFGNFDLYVASRASVSEPWGIPLNLGPQINTALNENFPLYWDAGRTLLFRSHGLGTPGQPDIFAARLVPEPAAASLLGVALGALASRTNWRRRSKLGAGRKAGRRRTLRLESLEPRQVLSSAPPTISLSDAVAIEGDEATKYFDALVAPASGGLQNARGFDFGPDGNIYISAERHWEDPIQLGWVNRYDGVTGRFLGVFASHPSMTGAKDVEFGPDGNLYVPNNVGDNIYRFNGQTGAFLDVFVPTGLGGLDTPRSIVFGVDASGDGIRDAYVTSAVTDNVLRYDTVTGAFLDEFVASGSGGLNDPTALVFGPNGDLFVASGAHSDYYNSILRYDGTTGAFKGVFVAAGSAGLTLAPTAGAIFGPDANSDGAWDMYVSNGVGDEVLIFSGASGSFISKFIAAGQGGLNDPKGLHFDADGNLLVISNYDSILRFGKSSQAAFTVSLSAPSDAVVSVDYATASGTAASGSDFKATGGAIVFQPGETTRTIIVSTTDDETYEPGEAFSLFLANASGGEILDGQGVATIADNDPSPTKFYVVNDAALNRNYEYNAAGGSVENYALNSGNAAPRGAASTVAGDKVWVVDANRKVYVYNTSGGLLGSWTAGTLASNATPEGIATNGTDVWIVDTQSDKVFRYTGAAGRLSGSQNAVSSFSLNSGNRDPKDLVTDGAHLWTVNDSSTNKVFKYTVAGSLIGSWTIGGANTTPTGITLDPANVSDLWIVDSGTDKVYQYAAAAGRTSGSLSAVATFNLAAGNSNPQGIADPPAGATTGISTARSAAIPFPSLSTTSQSLNRTPGRRPMHSAITTMLTSEYVPSLVKTKPVTQQAIGNGKPWQRHEMFAEVEAVDAAIEELDFCEWPELLGEM